MKLAEDPPAKNPANGGPSLRLPIALVLGLWLVISATGCTTSRSHESSDILAWKTWQAERRESVAGTNGWTTVVGLHWLAAGRHAVGPNADDTVRVPTAGHLGELLRTGREVWFHPAAGSKATVNGRPIATATRLVSDQPGPATKLRSGNVEFWLLERGERLGIRVRDPTAAARRQFRGLTYFPWQLSWRLEARFEAHPAGQTLPISDVTGATRPEPNPGTLVFVHEAREYRLEALADAETHDLFILFRDATNGSTTYAPGRFLHAPLPGVGGQVILDFNRAYNPPCAFTAFATCPRPPPGNQLPFPVNAGERRYGKE